MSAIPLRVFITLILLPLQAGIAILLCGVAQLEFDAPQDFPYYLIVWFPLVPLMSAIWMKSGNLTERFVAWAIGVIIVIACLLALYPIALEFVTSEAFHNPLGTERSGAVFAFYLICLVIGFLPVWGLLRSKGNSQDEAK